MTARFKRGLVLILAAALLPATAAPASADFWPWGGPGPCVMAGIAGAGMLGMAMGGNRPYYSAFCRPGPLECWTFAAPCFHNGYGGFVCPPPERRCFRRPLCE